MPRLAWLGRRLAHATLIGAAAMVAACGGGGGGDGGDSGGSRPGGTLALDRTSVAFSAIDGGPSPASQDVIVTYSGSDVAGVIAGIPPGMPVPTWLGGTFIGSTSPIIMRLTATMTVPPGEYSTTVRVATVRADQSVVAQRDVVVTHRVHAPLVPVDSAISWTGTFGAANTATASVTITAPALGWTVSASAPWIVPGATSGQGNATLVVDLNAAGLAAGSHSGEVVIRASNGAEQRIPVSLAISVPQLSVPASVTLGGGNGRDLAPRDVSLSLATGSAAHPWTVSGAPPWLTLSSANGMVSGAAVPLTLGVNRSAATPGVHNATLTFTANVNGQQVHAQTSVVLNLDEHRVLAGQQAVSLVKTPTRSVLSRAVHVRSNLGVATAWTAQSDRAWLTVTPSGTTGAHLVVTADPASLAADQLHLATVTITSSDASVVAQDRIRVGLWKGTADAPAQRFLADGFTASTRVVADPLRPHVYVHDEASVVGYHLYTGQETMRIAVGGSLADMAISGDGSRLFVDRTATAEIVPIDLDASPPAQLAGWASPGNRTQHDALVFSRINGRDVVLSQGGAFAAASGQRYTRTDGESVLALGGVVAAAGAWGMSLYTAGRLTSPAWVERWETDLSLMYGAGLRYEKRREVSSFPWGGGVADLAAAADGSFVYAPLAVLHGSELTYLGPTLGPNSFQLAPQTVRVGADGTLLFGLGVAAPTPNLVSVAPDGTMRDRGISGTAGIMRMALSGDAQAAIALGFVEARSRLEVVFVPLAP